MTTRIYSLLTASLSIMEGFPQWSEQMSDLYFMQLQPVTDKIGEEMAREVLMRYMKRPSVKALLEWAHSLQAPDLQFEPPWKSDAPRLTGPTMAQSVPPEDAKRIIEQLRSRAEKATPREFGLQFRDKATGHVSRAGAMHTQERAEALAAERNAKWQHIETSVYRKGDPVASAREMATA